MLLDLLNLCSICSTIYHIGLLSRPEAPYISSSTMQSEFIFRVEGTGVLSVEEVILTAVDVLTAKLRNLQQALPEVTGED